MVSNISSCTKVLVLPIVLWVVSSFSLRAQEKDFATWANAGFECKLKPAFTVSGGLEWRTKDDLGKTDRWGLKVGGSYKLLPFLKLGAGYETHYRNRGGRWLEVPAPLPFGRHSVCPCAKGETVLA